eukprot:g21861.t1
MFPHRRQPAHVHRPDTRRDRRRKRVDPRFGRALVAGVLLVGVLLPTPLPAQSKAGTSQSTTPGKSETSPSGPQPVPDGDTDALLRYIRSTQARARSIKHPVEFRKYQSAILEAAEKLLAAKTDKATEVTAIQAKFVALSLLSYAGDPNASRKLLTYANGLTGHQNKTVAELANKQLLMFRAQRVAKMKTPQQKELVQDVVQFLDSGNISQRISVGMTTARNLESMGSHELAAVTYKKMATVLGRSKDKRLAEYGTKLAGSARRVMLLGKPLDIRGTTIAGKPFRWSDYKGKAVLVLFCASWSARCVAEISNIKKTYNRYHNQGFDVVLISLDRSRDKDKLQALIRQQKIPWAVLFRARQKAYLMKGTGDVHFPASTKSPLAQKFIDQGLGQLYGFWYFEAERSFRQAAAIDPDCAIAYWGMAMANKSNSKRSKGFMKKALERKAKATDREQLYIDAMNAYVNSSGRERGKRGRVLADAFGKIAKKYPKDIEAKALQGLFWYSTRNQKPKLTYEKIDGLLKEVLAVNPMHPCHHFVIHLWDYKDASKALKSASLCGQSAPSIAHMWHMPGHIYSRLKRYRDAVWQQEASARVDHAHMMRDQVLPDQIHNFAHNNEWLIRNLIYVGRAGDALDLARNMIELPRHPKYNTISRGSTRYGRMRLFQVLSEFEMWDQLIALAETPYLEPTTQHSEQVKRRRYLGRAWFGKGNVAKANEILAKLEVELNREKAARDKAVAAAVAKLQKQNQPVSAAKPKSAGGKTKAAPKRRKIAARTLRRGKRTTRSRSLASAKTAAGRPFATKIRILEQAVNELKGRKAIAAGDLKNGLELLKKSGGISQLDIARAQQAAGKLADAEKTLTTYAKSRKTEVLPLAHLVDVLWKAGKRKEATEAFTKLRTLAGEADLHVPAMERLAEVAHELKMPTDWRTPAPPSKDTGKRPNLDSLGPFRWQPHTAANWSLKDVNGKAHSLKDYRGKPVVVIFYLGFGCLHCAEQLQAFAPKAKAFSDAGFSLIAISTDNQYELKKSHKNYKGTFPFPLVSDAKLDVFHKYRVFDDFEKQPLHGTFVIDGKGRVRWHDISYEPFMKPDFVLEEAKRLLAQSKSPTVKTPATNRPNATLPRNFTMKTLGGRQFWGDVAFFHDWKIQQNTITGHYRLLDGDDYRHASGTLAACRAKLREVREQLKLPPMKGEAVIVIHGITRSSKSLSEMQTRLRNEGYTVFAFGYPSTCIDIPQSAEYLKQAINSLEGIEKIHLVVHSMGGLVVRSYASGKPDKRIARLVMIGVPNKGAWLADKLKDNPFYKMVYGPAGQQLVSTKDGFVHKLPVPKFPFAVIAGARGTPNGYNPLQPGDDDGTVTVDSARLPGAADFMTFWGDVHFFHDWRIQQNTLTGHYRLLDRTDRRHASGTLDACLERLDAIRQEQNLPAMKGKAAIVIHGIIRSSKSFARIRKRLEALDFTVFGFDYPSTRVGIPRSAEYLQSAIQSLEGIDEIHFVVHSMGGLIVRAYLAGGGDERIRRMVMMGVPNNGARLADRLKKNPLFKLILGQAGQQMVSDEQGFTRTLPIPEFEFAIIAGARGTLNGYNPLVPGDDDGTVSVTSARLPGAADFMTVKCLHSFLMNNPEAIDATVELFGFTNPADAEQHALGDQPFSAFEMNHGGLRNGAFHADHVFTEPEHDPLRPGVVQQRVDDFAVAEFEQSFAAVDDRDVHTEGREHDRVLDADHAAADDNHRSRDALQIEKVVGIENRFAVEGNVIGPRRFRPRRDQNLVSGDGDVSVASADFHIVRADEPGVARVNVDAVTLELIADDIDFDLRDVRDLPPEVVHRDATLFAVPVAVNIALPVTRQMHDRFTHGLRGNRAAVQADAPHRAFLPLDDGDPLPELRGGNRPLLPGRTTPDNHKIVVRCRSLHNRAIFAGRVILPSHCSPPLSRRDPCATLPVSDERKNREHRKTTQTA